MPTLRHASVSPKMRSSVFYEGRRDVRSHYIRGFAACACMNPLIYRSTACLTSISGVKLGHSTVFSLISLRKIRKKRGKI